MISTEVLVIGSGVAGLSAALAAAPAQVTVVTKTGFGTGNSTWAQGGVAVALGPDDSAELHAADTSAVGVNLNDLAAVRILTSEGPDRAQALVDLGARFDRDDDGRLALGREAAHSVRRILHAADATGAEMTRALRDAVAGNPSIRVVEQALVVDLVVEDGRVVGALVRHGTGALVVYRADAVVLAAGGSGRLYSATTNPPEATADGIALAARAGAVTRDLEFVQFHPTALAAPGADPLPLVTEAIRGEGALIVDEDDRRFVLDVHPAGELAPRDVVARAVAAHRLAGHRTYLDARAAVGERFPSRFPTVYASCLALGIDPITQLIPISPAAHYHMGGVVTDVDGRTNVDGLWAAGEVAATGVHGANRLASNSLLEGLVFGARAGANAAAAATSAGASRRSRSMSRSSTIATSIRPSALSGATRTSREQLATVTELRRVMWERVGVTRDHRGLSDAVARLDALVRPGLDPEAANLLLVARLVARAALIRTESRGAHQRADFPMTDPAWERHIDVRVLDGHPIAGLSPEPYRASR